MFCIKDIHRATFPDICNQICQRHAIFSYLFTCNDTGCQFKTFSCQGIFGTGRVSCSRQKAAKPQSQRPSAKQVTCIFGHSPEIQKHLCTMDVFSKAIPIATPIPICYSLGVGVAIAFGIDFLLRTYGSVGISAPMCDGLIESAFSDIYAPIKLGLTSIFACNMLSNTNNLL